MAGGRRAGTPDLWRAGVNFEPVNAYKKALHLIHSIESALLSHDPKLTSFFSVSLYFGYPRDFLYLV